MAAKKKKKKAKTGRKPAGRSTKKTKAKKTAARKAPSRKAKKKPTAKKTKAAKKKKPAARKAAAPARKKKKQTVGEGDYAASRSFLKDQAGFVARNRSDIPAMGKEAERALEGPEGDALRQAEASASARSRDSF